MKLKNRMWIWGQDVMSHQNALGNRTWKLPGGNKLDPAAGAAYLGIPNIFRVVMCGSPEPPFDAESEKLKHCLQVVWSAMGDSGSHRNDQASDLDEVIRQKGLYPNITGAVYDDFFCHPPESDVWARYDIDEIRSMRDWLHAARLDMYVVWYKRQLEFPIDDYLKTFDVITYWNMKAPAEGAQLADDLARVVERTPGKRRMTGCYIWNYGEGKPLSVAEIKRELDAYYGLIKKGLSEGIIFCSNCCADLPEGKEAVDYLRNWLREVGEEEL